MVEGILAYTPFHDLIGYIFAEVWVVGMFQRFSYKNRRSLTKKSNTYPMVLLCATKHDRCISLLPRSKSIP